MKKKLDSVTTNIRNVGNNNFLAVDEFGNVAQSSSRFPWSLIQEGTNVRLKNARGKFLQKDGNGLVLADDALSPSTIASNRTPNLALQQFVISRDGTTVFLKAATNERQVLAFEGTDVLFARFTDKNDAGISKKSFVLDLV